MKKLEELTMADLIALQEYCSARVKAGDELLKTHYAKEDAEWDECMKNSRDWDDEKYPDFERQMDFVVLWDERGSYVRDEVERRCASMIKIPE